MLVIQKIVRYCFHDQIPADGHKLATQVHGSMVMFMCLTLVFILNQALGKIASLEQMVAIEASHIKNLDKLLGRVTDPIAKDTRLALYRYAASVVDQEWPAMALGQSSRDTNEKLIHLTKSADKLKSVLENGSATGTSMMSFLDQIDQSRLQRLEAKRARLPVPYWYAISVLFLVVVVTSAFVEQGKISKLILCLEVSALSALLALVLIFDAPFQGDVRVNPDSIQNVIQSMHAAG